MLKELGPFQLPSSAMEPGSNVRVMSSDEANIKATYCGDCNLVWIAPTGSWGIALRFANEHRGIHAQWNIVENVIPEHTT
jgi:hypothetical protein